MQEFKMPFSEKIASIGISFDVPNKKEITVPLVSNMIPNLRQSVLKLLQ